MKVSLIAQTNVNLGEIEALGFTPNGTASRMADHLIEFAGRSCYQSFSRPNPETAHNRDYMANILESGHFSVLEHASATFYVQGVSRALTHELIRHRHLSYSQLSQRFVNEKGRAEAVEPPAFKSSGHRTRLNALAGYVEHVTQEAYTEAVHILEREGLSRKEAREAARAFLPNQTETRIVVSGNHRAWRDFLAKRYDAHADAEIREFATLVLRDLRSLAPNVYQDIPSIPYNTPED